MGSFARLTYHVVFGTKFRRKSIHEDFKETLYQYIGGIIKNRKGVLIQIGGIEDHVHLLLGLPPNLTVSDAIRDVKANTSKWINEKREFRKTASDKFEWQIGFGAFTVSYSHTETIRNYILGQEEHHRHKSFQEEYIELLKKHDIKFDRKYIFEAEHVG
jgi:REP element-mobilizing transposase RayT